MAQARRKKVGLKNVAELAGVSVSAVSMALSDSPQIGGDTKERVRKICREIGYPLKRNRRRRQQGPAKRFGFLTVDMNLQDEGLAAMLQGLTNHSREHKIRLEISAVKTEDDKNAFGDHLREYANGLDGVLLCGVMDETVLRTLQDSDIPAVVVGYQMDLGAPVMPRYHSVRCDAVEMGQAATRWLIRQGHQRIGFFCERVFPGMYAANWIDGYRIALWQAGIGPREDWLHVTGEAFTGGAPAAKSFDQLDETPSAFVCPDIRTAASFIDAMHELGRQVNPRNLVIGGQQQLVPHYGVEDFPLIAEDDQAVAAAAIDFLTRIVEGDTPRETVLLVPFDMYNML